MKRRLGLGLLLCCAGLGCAGATHGPRATGPKTEAARGWAALVDGKDDLAAERFARALARDHGDLRARFGAANLARERGDNEAALEHAIALVAAASEGEDGAADVLAAAMLSRIPRMLDEAPDRRPAEERLIEIDGRRLGWQARYALALVVIDIARRRADAALLAKASAAAGCAKDMSYVGTGGRLPMLDLSAETFVAAKHPRPLLATGCQFQLNTEDGRLGIKVVRSELELSSGRHDIVLDFSGPARLRVDNGPWHSHASSRDVYGPRWSAFPVETAAGRHKIEIRLGLYGSSADVSLLAMPTAKPFPEVRAGSDGEAAMLELARTLAANLSGDSDAVSALVDRLIAHPRFAVGLAAAGRLRRMDVTQPADVTRDKARGLWRQALAVDAKLARVWLDLSELEMQRERPREAAEDAERACQLAPKWWPAHLALATALRGQGLERPADDALAAGLALVESGQGGCLMIEKALHRAQARDEMAAAGRLVKALARCDAQSPHPKTWAEDRGDLDEALARLTKALPTSPEPLWLLSDIADVQMARGEPSAAVEVLATIIKYSPRDTLAWIRLADARQASGMATGATATLAEAVRRFPGRTDVRRAARLAGLALPLDDYRVDGAQVVRDYLASGRSYQAPAVVVLDRAVERVFFDGTRLMLTHTISQVLSKDAIEHVGEVQVPAGAEVLTLRTRKADGTLREAEEIAGKQTISAPNLAVGDFVESETLEIKPPREAFAPGFIGERFYFESFDAPLDRSEYVFIAPAHLALDVNSRADAPKASEARGPDDTRVLTFVAREKAQVFPERAAVPPVEWIPSVRVSSGAGLRPWARFVGERFTRIVRGSPELRRVAAEIERQTDDRTRLPEAIATWVAEHIIPESNFTEPATVSLARERGNRAGLMVALARSLRVPAELVMARSRLTADAAEPPVPGELDQFRDVLVFFPRPGRNRFVDPRLRRAPFGYVAPGLDGAPAIVAGTGEIVKVSSSTPDRRRVTLRGRLAADGSAELSVMEDVTGWPAVEWCELLDRVGKDRTKLRQGFEQFWLGHHFPGAQLDSLTVDANPDASRTRVAYTLKVGRLADRQGAVLRLRPTFFRSQPGRRYGTEPRRKTALSLGPDVEIELDAQLTLPKGTTSVDVGQSGVIDAGEAHFLEERKVDKRDGVVTVKLRRDSRLPLMRVSPVEYQGIAAKLRAVDSIEQSEIHITLAGE